MPLEQNKFHDKVENVLSLARKEAIASGIFFGSTGWSGNVTLLALLGYGNHAPYACGLTYLNSAFPPFFSKQVGRWSRKA